MPFAILCTLAADASLELKRLRASHLSYIRDHVSEVLFGGPTRNEAGAPETMIIVLRTNDRQHAESFIACEPYNASGKVFSHVAIRAWSQVVPEPSPGALDAAITSERLAHTQHHQSLP